MLWVWWTSAMPRLRRWAICELWHIDSSETRRKRDGGRWEPESRPRASDSEDVTVCVCLCEAVKFKVKLQTACHYISENVLFDAVLINTWYHVTGAKTPLLIWSHFHNLTSRRAVPILAQEYKWKSLTVSSGRCSYIIASATEYSSRFQINFIYCKQCIELRDVNIGTEDNFWSHNCNWMCL
jgi:hypothetical protein